MPVPSNIILFSLAALIMVLTPGPNMIYLISRSICQGKFAGIVSLLGVISALIFYVFAATFGLTAIFLLIPYAYEIVKTLGALYLGWLAWKVISQKSSLYTPNKLGNHSFFKLYKMGFLTCLLNPKVAIFYMSLFPQFINPHQGSMILQTLFLGFTQLSISFICNGTIVLTAASLCNFFNKNIKWAKFQQWLMGLTLGGLAIRLALSKQVVS